jgi:hypothetical protein
MKEHFDALRKATAAADEIESTLTSIEKDLSALERFVDELRNTISDYNFNTREDIFSDFDKSEFEEARKNLASVSDKLLVVLNNLDYESSVPTDTTAVSIKVDN